MWQPSAFTGISALVASEPIDRWKDYLTFHAIQSHGGVLPRVFSLENFAFFGTTLSGVQKQRDRWKRGVNVTNNALGYAVGKLYAEQYFPAADKARVQQLVKNLIVAFGVRIDSLAWMAPATKKEAKAKLAVLKVGVGYPDKWPEYTGLKVVANDLYGNAERSNAYEQQRNLKMLDLPVDRAQWVMTPQTVNAEPAGAQRHELPGDPAVTLFAGSAGVDGPWRHRCHDRSRDQPASTARAQFDVEGSQELRGLEDLKFRKHRRSSSLRSTTRTSRSPTSRSTGRRH